MVAGVSNVSLTESATEFLEIPDVRPGMNILSAALLYADAGWYVVPSAPDKPKNPGSILGKQWQYQSSRDPDIIKEWFALHQERGIVLHAGKSGSVIFDVDRPELLHPLLKKAIEECEPPFQTSRPSTPGKGHAIFRVPPGFRIGNSAGKIIGGTWGETRGRNGVIAVCPSIHENANDSEHPGLYLWEAIGRVPMLPEFLLEAIPNSMGKEDLDAASDDDIKEFFALYNDETDPVKLEAIVTEYERELKAKGSHHNNMQDKLCWAMREAACGYFPASKASRQLGSLFRKSFSMQDSRQHPNRGEFTGMVSWAVGQITEEEIAAKKALDAEKAAKAVAELERQAEESGDENVFLNQFSDTVVAETIADECLQDHFIWCKSLGWLGWTGKVWEDATEESVFEFVRLFIKNKAIEAVRNADASKENKADRKGWISLLAVTPLRRVFLGYVRGIVEHKGDEFDTDPDVINLQNGLFHFKTGELHPHHPSMMVTKIANGSWKNGADKHPDLLKMLTALAPEEAHCFQNRIGQAITGHPTPDEAMLILQGTGENGKSLLTTDGVVPAFGGYAFVASPKLLQGAKNEHSTERAELRGKRFIIAEELTEGRNLDVTVLKQILGESTLTARFIRKDNISFDVQFSLFTTTNYLPVIKETDHGTWRRLVLLVFPFTFLKPGIELANESDRYGDLQLKSRVKFGLGGQHDAIVTWAIIGAMRWYNDPNHALEPTKKMNSDTSSWRNDTDRIMGFWKECLDSDPKSCVLSDELYEEFNTWLLTNGHNEWSKETLINKFKTHTETLKNDVKAKQVKSRKALDGLNSPTRDINTLGESNRIFRGVRFKPKERKNTYYNL